MPRQKRQFARQGAASDLPDRAAVLSYLGAPGEPIFDGDRLRMMDGVTAGGIPLVRCGRRAIADQNASLTGADAYVALTSLTATRTLSLPAAAIFIPGQPLFIADESGAVSADNNLKIMISASGADKIGTSDGPVQSIWIGSPYQKLTFHSNGSNLWTFA